MESIDTETTTHVVYAAVLAVKLIGGTLGLAVLGAMWDAVSPETLSWVTTHGLSGLSLALKLLMLAPVLITYLHLYRGHKLTTADLPERTRRRFAGYGRHFQGPGRHRVTA